MAGSYAFYPESVTVIGSNLPSTMKNGGSFDCIRPGVGTWVQIAGELGYYKPYTDPLIPYVDYSTSPEFNSVSYEIPIPANNWTSVEVTAQDRVNSYINAGDKLEVTYQQGYAHSYDTLTPPTITSITTSGHEANITFSDNNNYGSDIKLYCVKINDQFAGYATSSSLGGNNYRMKLHDISAEASNITLAAMKLSDPFSTGTYAQSVFSSPYQTTFSGDFGKYIVPGSLSNIAWPVYLSSPYFGQISAEKIMSGLYGSSNIESLKDQPNILFTGINSPLYKNKIKIHKVPSIIEDRIILTPTSKWSWTGVVQEHNIMPPFDEGYIYPAPTVGETGKFTPILFNTTLLVGKFEADIKIIGRFINASAGGVNEPGGGLSFRGLPKYDVEDVKINILSPYGIIRNDDVNFAMNYLAFPGTVMERWILLSNDYIGAGLYAEENPPIIEDFYAVGKDIYMKQKLIDEAIKEEYIKSKEMLAQSIRKSFLSDSSKHLTDSTASFAITRIGQKLEEDAASNVNQAKNFNTKIFGNIYMSARILLSPLPDTEFDYALIDSSTNKSIAQGRASAVILTKKNWTEYKLTNPNYGASLAF